jgi:integrase
VQDLYQTRSRAVAADTHRGELNQVRTLWRWAAERGLVRPGLWELVKPRGKRRRGKLQPRRAEARALYQVALQEASTPAPADRRRRGNAEGALAVLCALLLGYRASEIVALAPRDIDDDWAWVEEGKTRAAARHTRIPKDLLELLRRRAAEVRGRGGDRLFAHGRGWVLDHVKRLCLAAGIPKVTAHGLRGLHSTLATSAGATGELVAAQLGHESATVTRQHYIDPDALTDAAQGRVLDALIGKDNEEDPDGE